MGIAERGASAQGFEEQTHAQITCVIVPENKTADGGIQ